ncbi:uncharacterized protein LOC126679316 [Mercurialis annua]|uniref:uncharacterized protein LOC126679316 n=1 Tax=Mercurialis annua TaxID=3986 RepID=UPI00215E0908|nr:uncharacterized protein LOC126679316 [Mercurialis annua]
MPQVDLETLVSACAGVSCDSKVACETLATTTTTADNLNSKEIDQPEVPPDFPPESFWLSKDAELDWFDRNAFIDRKDSTKGNSHSTNLNQSVNPNSTSNSQRFSNLKSKASIFGLPKPQNSCFIDARRHCKPGNTRLFPKRSGSAGKSGSSVIEPTSPKVSCMGRVRSKRDRNRRLKHRQRSGRLNDSAATHKRDKPDRKQRNGFLANFRAIFSSTKKNTKEPWLKGKDSSLKHKSPKTTTVKISDIRDRLPAKDRDGSEPVTANSGGGAEPVGLGGMKRFTSGRKSESWIE